MRKHYTLFLLLFSLAVQVDSYAQKGKKKETPAPKAATQATPVVTPEAPASGTDPIALKEAMRVKDPKAVKAAQREKEKLAKLNEDNATAPSTSNAAYLAKLKANLTEDAGGNLLKPIIILPTHQKEGDQRAQFLLLKKLAESERPASNFIKDGKGNELVYLICSIEAFDKWMAANPSALKAFVYEGLEALQDAKEKFTQGKLEQEGIHKIIAEKLPKRLVPGQFIPTNAPTVSDKPESL